MTDDFYIPPIKQTHQTEQTTDSNKHQNKIFIGAIILIITTLGLMSFNNPSVFTNPVIFEESLRMIGGPILGGFILYLIITKK